MLPMVKRGVTGHVVVRLSRAFEFRGRCAAMARLRRCHCSRSEHSRSRRTARVVIGRISSVQLIMRGSDRLSESCTLIILVSNQSSNADGDTREGNKMMMKKKKKVVRFFFVAVLEEFNKNHHNIFSWTPLPGNGVEILISTLPS